MQTPESGTRLYGDRDTLLVRRMALAADGAVVVVGKTIADCFGLSNALAGESFVRAFC